MNKEEKHVSNKQKPKKSISLFLMKQNKSSLKNALKTLIMLCLSNW